MKFASKHPETIAALDKWANGETLITASFFFWNQGLAMQKTQLGLFQSLLYQVLRAAPELVSVLCPDHEIDEGWEIDDLKQTFQLLSRQKILPVKFCFFIDGLDEYNGEEEDILEVLNNLASSPNVKICTSSRPWPAFEEAFADLQRTLAVQDFTLDDMKSYVRDRLAEHPKFLTLQQEDSRCTKLIAQIAETSQGVWLWTYLVTNDMRSLIAHNEKYEMLHRTLESFPPRLEEYFANIIERRNPAFREEMCQIFLITAEAVQPVPILLFTYLQPQIQNAKYAINYDIMPISKWEVDDNYFDWRHQLHNRCGDLLRIECENEIDNFFRYRVDFLHRTVRDFLRDNHDGKLREGAGLTFNPTSSLCHLTLVLLKRFPVHNEFRANINRIIQLVDEILYYSHEAEKRGGPAQVELLDELDRVVSLFAKKEQNHWTHARDPPASGSLQKYTEGGNYNFLALAIQSRLVRYVRAKLDADPSLIGKKRGRPLLDYALRPKRKMPLSLAFHSQKEDISVSVAMVQLLLERGANPNQPIYLYDKQTVWELFLLSCSEHAEWASERLKSVWYEAVLMMIEHGARPLHSKDVRNDISAEGVQRCLEEDAGDGSAQLASIMVRLDREQVHAMEEEYEIEEDEEMDRDWV
ncbi:hypothetical protein AbraIFM66950_002273 [Aspergillus brasiliensis]|nr:hypothetical protein AbraIFM66950_002273 [Aspergillus brasiliensis]